MQLPTSSRSYVVFDLDDTLYPELDFVRSGFDHIAHLIDPVAGASLAEAMMRRFRDGEEVFAWLIESRGLDDRWTVGRLLDEYRQHAPALTLPPASDRLLRGLAERGAAIGLLTDGRASTQRHKLKALGLEDRFTDILISEEFGSEKPDPRNYEFFRSRHPEAEFTFIGDNTGKDFIVPNRLGWRTICLRDCGDNIHKQQLEREPRPDHIVGSLDEIELVAGEPG